jgi:hypothetical protein
MAVGDASPSSSDNYSLESHVCYHHPVPNIGTEITHKLVSHLAEPTAFYIPSSTFLVAGRIRIERSVLASDTVCPVKRTQHLLSLASLLLWLKASSVTKRSPLVFSKLIQTKLSTTELAVVWDYSPIRFTSSITHYSVACKVNSWLRITATSLTLHQLPPVASIKHSSPLLMIRQQPVVLLGSNGEQQSLIAVVHTFQWYIVFPFPWQVDCLQKEQTKPRRITMAREHSSSLLVSSLNSTVISFLKLQLDRKESQSPHCGVGRNNYFNTGFIWFMHQAHFIPTASVHQEYTSYLNLLSNQSQHIW